MRLWHFKLIPYLPKSQLLAQWRELNSIFKNQPHHILINYVYRYPKKDLCYYSRLVIEEMQLRGYKIKSFDKFMDYFSDMPLEDNFEASPEDNRDFVPFKRHHDADYLIICYYNLLEKYMRGQWDFEEKIINAIIGYCEPYIPQQRHHRQ